ncbi:uncharacterized protein [Dermacentor albipictus]|uniref:uncharacterized protein isoform X2 n=1 Tax=Dermacentor albipictus TaxID=60249 RepID=UPI0038FC7DBC
MPSTESGSSADAHSSSEVLRIQSHLPPGPSSGSPIQEIVDRAYRVHDEWSLACFIATSVALFLLLCSVAYFFLGNRGLLRSHYSPRPSLKGAPVLSRPRGQVPGPVMVCYYDPAWSNDTARGAWVYHLSQHFHAEQCTHAVLVAAEYGDRGIVLPRHVSESLANFLILRRPSLPVLVSVMVRDVTEAFSNWQQFAQVVVDWAIKNGFDGVELDMAEGTAARGYDALAQALSRQMALATQLWILSANVYMTPSFSKQVDLQALHRVVDFLVLNTQGLSLDDQVTSAHSPLYGKNSWHPWNGVRPHGIALSAGAHSTVHVARVRAEGKVAQPYQRLRRHRLPRSGRENPVPLFARHQSLLRDAIRCCPPLARRGAEATRVGRFPSVARVRPSGHAVRRRGYPVPAIPTQWRRQAAVDGSPRAADRGAREWKDQLCWHRLARL